MLFTRMYVDMVDSVPRHFMSILRSTVRCKIRISLSQRLFLDHGEDSAKEPSALESNYFQLTLNVFLSGLTPRSWSL